jgi:hypothetical protein
MLPPLLKESLVSVNMSRVYHGERRRVGSYSPGAIRNAGPATALLPLTTILVSGNHLLLDADGSLVVVAIATSAAVGINRQFAALPLHEVVVSD